MEAHINENPSAQAKKALFGDTAGKIKTFAVLTGENPLGNKLSCSENSERMEQLKSTLKTMNIQYTKIMGKENSLVLYNLAYSDAEYLARNFEQESFFYGTNNFPAEITYYETHDNCETYSKAETSRKISDEKDADDFFSRHSDYKFNISMQCFESDSFQESVTAVCDSIITESVLDKAVDDNKTMKSRIMYRSQSRRPY